MSERNHIADNCHRVREQLPEFMAGTLPDEQGQAVARHLADCAECSAQVALEPGLRARLDQGIALEGAPAGLAERINKGLDREANVHRRSRWQYGLAAAAVLLLGLNISTYSSHGILPHEFALAELRIRASLEKIHEMLGVGLGDHLICTVYRRLDEDPPSNESAVAEMGNDWAPLSAVAEEYSPAGFEVRLAHRCKYRGREFVHLAMHDGQQLMSLILTQRRDDDSMASAERDTAVQLAGIDVYGTAVDEFGLSAFATDEFLVYLVSDLSPADHAAAAAAYFPPVSTFLATATPITVVD